MVPLRGCLKGGIDLTPIAENHLGSLSNQIVMIPVQETLDLKSESRDRVVDDLTAVEALLRKIVPQVLEDRMLARITEWFVILKVFSELDVAYSCLKEPSFLEDRYRAALVSILAWGENIWSGLQQRPDVDLSPIQSSRGQIFSNLRYLREKYELRFVASDFSDVTSTLELIENARSGAEV